MVCIYCGSATKVVNSRPQKKSNSVWRRRKCLDCSAIVTSVEHIDLASSLRVKHSEGLEPFQKEKLLISIYESLKHVQAAPEKAKELTSTVCGLLVASEAEDATISCATIASVTAKVLKRFDNVAGLHYEAIHKNSR